MFFFYFFLAIFYPPHVFIFFLIPRSSAYNFHFITKSGSCSNTNHRNDTRKPVIDQNDGSQYQDHMDSHYQVMEYLKIHVCDSAFLATIALQTQNSLYLLQSEVPTSI